MFCWLQSLLVCRVLQLARAMALSLSGRAVFMRVPIELVQEVDEYIMAAGGYGKKLATSGKSDSCRAGAFTKAPPAPPPTAPWKQSAGAAPRQPGLQGAAVQLASKQGKDQGGVGRKLLAPAASRATGKLVFSKGKDGSVVRKQAGAASSSAAGSCGLPAPPPAAAAAG